MGTSQRRTTRSARLQVRLSDEDIRRLRVHAADLGLPLSAATRALALTALSGRPDGRLDQLEAVSVAALMAGEHAVRLLELLMPGGARRSADLAGAVRLAALDRIAAVREDLEESGP